MSDKEVLLKVENLRQYFKDGKNDFKAVDGVSFDIKRGEVFGVVGESGCGKTTTGRGIIKLYQITGGNVYFKGERISAGLRDYKDAIAECRKKMKDADSAQKDELAKEISRQKKLMAEAVKVNRTHPSVTDIQMIFQDPISSLNPRMTVREIISEGLVIKGEKDKDVIDRKVYDILETVGLVREHAGRYPHEFSGGQRQRIGIARAVVMNPDLIIADEPVSALDVSIQAQVINLLNELRQKMNLTIMFIAHNLSVVKYFSDRIAVMYFGKIVELADSDELFKHPLHPYTKSLLSAIPYPDPHFEKHRKRIIYKPEEVHDYSKEQPELAEITPGHFVSANSAELSEYRKELGI
ncbi:MAG: ABC transporter ATP-binding protein [Butyrivibrio sp.]